MCVIVSWIRSHTHALRLVHTAILHTFTYSLPFECLHQTTQTYRYVSHDRKTTQMKYSGKRNPTEGVLKKPILLRDYLAFILRDHPLNIRNLWTKLFLVIYKYLGTRYQNNENNGHGNGLQVTRNNSLTDNYTDFTNVKPRMYCVQNYFIPSWNHQ